MYRLVSMSRLIIYKLATSTPRINKNCTNGLSGTKWNSPWWMANPLASLLEMQRKTLRSKDRLTAKSHRKLTRFQDCIEALQMAVVSLKLSACQTLQRSAAGAPQRSRQTWRGSHRLCATDARQLVNYCDALTQFSASSAGTRANSPMLFVTSTKPSLRACAAMCMSFTPIGRPSFSKAARMAP